MAGGPHPRARARAGAQRGPGAHLLGQGRRSVSRHGGPPCSRGSQRHPAARSPAGGAASRRGVRGFARLAAQRGRGRGPGQGDLAQMPRAPPWRAPRHRRAQSSAPRPELASHDVAIEGSVPSVRPYLDRAFATAVPLRAGSGTRIKILEAWAAGVPVIASRIAAEGLPYSDGKDLILAEDPGEFARGLVRLWRDQQLAEQLAREGQRTVEPFTVEKVGETVARDYRELLDPASARLYNEAYAPAMAATP